MKVKIDGQDYTGFTNLEFTRHFLNVVGEFTFTASPLDIVNESYPLQAQQSCEITVEDTGVLSGFIEIIRVNSSSGEVKISAQGRDKICDLVDSTVDRSIFGAFVGPTTLKTICEQVISKLGITNISVIDNVGSGDTTFNSGDYIVAQTGESAFAFLERYARKKQVLLATDGSGNLTIERGSSSILDAQILNEFDSLNNNVVSSSSSIDISKRFNKYITYSQYFNLFGNVDYDASSLTDALTNSKGEATDSDIRATRQYVFLPDTPLVVDGGNNRALWEANYKKAQSFAYECELSEYTYDGTNIWPLNRLVKVIDDFANVNSYLLIDSVTFVQSLSGNYTKLRLIPQDSYNLIIKEDYRQELAKSTGNAFFSGG